MPQSSSWQPNGTPNFERAWLASNIGARWHGQDNLKFRFAINAVGGRDGRR
jgi:hypothetical protein